MLKWFQKLLVSIAAVGCAGWRKTFSTIASGLLENVLDGYIICSWEQPWTCSSWGGLNGQPRVFWSWPIQFSSWMQTCQRGVCCILWWWRGGGWSQRYPQGKIMFISRIFSRCSYASPLHSEVQTQCQLRDKKALVKHCKFWKVRYWQHQYWRSSFL